MSTRLMSLVAAFLVAACAAENLNEVNLSERSSNVQWDPFTTIGQHFDYVQDGSRASQATGMLEVPILGDRVQQTVPSKKGPPFPSVYHVRGTCGVTFIAPHYAITAAHCVASANLPDPNTLFPVYTYDITGVAETWLLDYTAINRGEFPDYEPLGGIAGGYTAADVPGYHRLAHTCFVRARCAFGTHNCGFGADIALIKCLDNARADAWLPVAKQDPESGPVDMYWFHELLKMPVKDPGPTPPADADRFTHYTHLGAQKENFHYLDSPYNAILPFKSIPWPDRTERKRLGTSPSGTTTDLFGCHGTSGSGVLQLDNKGNHELLGPVVTGGKWVADRLCTDVEDFQPGRVNVVYERNTFTRQLESAFLPELNADRGI